MFFLLGTAHAFCGAYVGSADSELTNRDSRIVIARNGEHVRLTMFNDVGDISEEFGLIVPIPHKVDQRHVWLVDEDAMTVTEFYARPRLVEYSCENFYTQDPAARASLNPFLMTGCSDMSVFGDPRWADTDAPAWVDTANGVVVEEQFILGEYEIFVLQANQAEGLMSWMEGNGFVAPPETAEVLQDYIDDGQYFLAAKVDPDRMTSRWLSPLQLHYQSAGTTLPIRLGATSSAGVQDLVLTVIDTARVSISNQGPETLMSRDCMTDEQGWDYGAMWTEASGIPDNPEEAEGIDAIAWTTEFSWKVPSKQSGEVWGTVNGVKCDPCYVPPEAGGGDDPFPDWVVRELGYPWPESGYHVTRLRLRYTPGGVTDDLVLYNTGSTDRQQNRYVVHKWELESLVPLCDGGIPEEPGSCYSAEYWARQSQGELVDGPELISTNACGCSSSQGGSTALMLLGLLGLGRRRR